MNPPRYRSTDHTPRVLVTGVTGTVGACVARALGAEQAIVRGGARQLPEPPARVPKVEYLGLDFANDNSITKALRDVDALFLLTPLSARMPEQVARIIRAAAHGGVRRVVRLSAFGAGEGITRLGRVHREAEEIVENAGMAWTLLRPNAFMQNYLNQHAAEISARGRLCSPQGDGRVSLIDARDIAAVAALALTRSGHAGKTYELTGPEALNDATVAAILSANGGHAVHHEEITAAQAGAEMRTAGLPVWLIDLLLELYTLSRAGGAARVTPTCAKLLGRAPRSFAEFARDHRAAFFPHGKGE